MYGCIVYCWIQYTILKTSLKHFIRHRTLLSEQKIACFIFLLLWQVKPANRCVTSVNLSTRASPAWTVRMDTTTPTVSVCHVSAMGTPSQAAHPASATQTPETAWTAATTPTGLTASIALVVSPETHLPGTARPSVSHRGFKTIRTAI